MVKSRNSARISSIASTSSPFTFRRCASAAKISRCWCGTLPSSSRAAMNKTIETIPADTMKALSRYHWPGNIRELQNVIERAVIVSSGPVLRVPVGDLRQRPEPSKTETAIEVPEPKNIRNVLEEAERKQIIDVLQETNWVVAGPNGAAIRLGMKRSTLQFHMQKLGISRNAV